MTRLTKVLATGAAVAAIGLASGYAFAQHGPGSGHGRMGTGMGPGTMKGHGMMGGPGMMGQGHGQMMGDLGDPAMRLAEIKTQLGIKPEQTAAWDAYAKVMTDTAAERRDHREHIDRDAVRAMTPTERQQHFTAMQEQRDAAFAKVKAAAEALVARLEPDQQVKARQTLPGLVAVGPGGGMRHGMMGGQGPGHQHH